MLATQFNNFHLVNIYSCKWKKKFSIGLLVWTQLVLLYLQQIQHLHYEFSDQYEVSVINTCGEWDKFISEFSANNIEVINLNFRYFKILPKTGFLKSRFSYILIILLSFFPLIFLLKNKKPDIFIAHLITSLPIWFLNFLPHSSNFKNFRNAKVKFFRKNLWKFCSSSIKMITCPTIELKNKIENYEIINKEKFFTCLMQL